MKSIISTLFLILFFVGCSTNNLSKSTIEPKNSLIKKADKGDIQAMLVLNKYYNFPYTKEGLTYYSKWYKSIDKNDNPNDIYEITKVYAQYHTMFVNGQDKVIKLFKLSEQAGKNKVIIQEIKFLFEIYKQNNIEKLEEKILSSLTDEEVLSLEKIYSKYYYSKGKKKISEIKKERGIKPSFEDTLKKIRILLYKKKDEEYYKLVEQVIKSKNTNNMLELAIMFNKKYEKVEELKVHKEILKIDKSNDKVYYALAQIYSKGIYKKVEKDISLAIKYTKKAAQLGNQDAYYKLLEIYSSKKEYSDDYFELIEELNSTKDGQFILAKFYEKNFMKEKAYVILENLAKEGYEEAILKLALLSQSQYKFSPEQEKIQEKWQKYIHTSNNRELKNKYKKSILKNKYSKDYASTVLKDRDEDIKNGNILTLRRLSSTLKYKKPDEAFKYLQQGANTGDVRSILTLAREYRINKKHINFKKALEILEILAKKGDKIALRTLGDLYLNPPKGFEEFVNEKKALEYYKLGAKKGDPLTIRKLVTIYICDTCKNKKLLDYEKGVFYLKQLQKEGKGRDSASLAWMYNTGKGVKKDLLKAKKYYEKAKKEGFLNANYYLAWLYYKDKDSPIDPIRVDHKKALEYLEDGVKLNNNDCMNLLGVFYENGYGVKKDIQKAIDLYKKAYKMYKNTHAAYNIGFIYHKGKGNIKKNLSKAKEWYKKSNSEKAIKQLKKLQKNIK